MSCRKNDLEEAVGIKVWEISPPPLGKGRTLKKKILSCLPQQKKKRDKEANALTTNKNKLLEV